MLYRDTYRVESARHPEFAYVNPAFYFITICTRDRYPYFGEIPAGTAQMQFSNMGHLAERIWLTIPQQYSFIKLNEYVVMPNHVHGILQIVGYNKKDEVISTDEDAINRVSTVGSAPGGITGGHNPMVQKKSISTVIRWFKGRVTFEAKSLSLSTPFGWQTRFYDRVIRNEEELGRIQQYIHDNPAHWDTDEENAHATPP